MNDHVELPFSPTTQALSAWLETLASQAPTNAALQIYQSIKLLKRQQNRTGTEFSFAHQSYPAQFVFNQKVVKTKSG